MRTAIVGLGTDLIIVGLFGLLTLAVYMAVSFATLPFEMSPSAPSLAGVSVPEAPTRDPDSALAESQLSVQQASIEVAPRDVTRLRIERIRLNTEVVPAKFVDKDGGTWDVPAFKAGHAEFTAGAGQPGNVVLFGHVTSLTLGNVFHDLGRVRVGDRIEVASGSEEFDYQVTEVRVVPRTEVSVIEPTENASISLITCTGLWLPQLRDYADRLVVRGELQVREPVREVTPGALFDELAFDKVIEVATALDDFAIS